MLEQLNALQNKLQQWWANWQEDKEERPQDTATLLAELQAHTLSNILPYQSYDTDTQLYVNKRSAGFILETTPLTGANEETVNILATILTDTLPKEADFQVLLWASDKVGDVLERFEKKRSGKGEIFEWLAKMRTDYLKQGAYSSLIQNGILIIRDFRLLLVVSMPHKHYEDVVEDLMTLRDDIQSSLKSVNMSSRALPVEDFLSILNDLTSPSSNTFNTQTPWQELDDLASQITNPECILKVHPHHLSFETEQETWEARCFSVRNFPKTMAQWKMTDSIGQLFNSALQIPSPFLISLNVRLLDHEQSAAKAQLHYMDKDKMAKSPMAKFNPIAGEQRNDWEFVRKRLSEGDRLVKTFFQVILYAPKKHATMAERKVRDLYRANGWKLRKESYLQLQSWLAMLPMMMTEGLYKDFELFKRMRTMTAFNAINIAPLQGEWRGSISPGLLLPGRRGQLATWLPFDNQEGNYNVAIAAASGKGKSVFTQEYIVSILGSGGRVWVIDIGRSYEKTCKLIGGEFIEFSLENPICINPFSLVRNLDESMEMLKPLLASMARPSGRASDEELSWLEKAIKAAWELKGNQSTISTVADWLKAQEKYPACQNLHLLLYSYTKEGMYARYFEGEANINFNNPFVVLELQELKAKKDLQRIVLLVLMYQISETMYLGNRSQYKSCIIDEAWDLLGGDNDNAAKFIEAGYRTARRYTGNFVTITQSINDYFKNSAAMAAFDNSDNMIILGQKPEAIDQAKKSERITMDAFSERLYKSLRKTDEFSECVIKTPSGLSVHRIIFDPYSRILYSSKGVEFDAVKKLQTQGHSLKDAISIVASRQAR
jgi:conjugal transfer ATP-binding protein TraC